MSQQELADLLEAVLQGDGDLNRLMNDSGMHGIEFDACYHNLWHYLLDADIRSRDPDYAAMQNEEMSKLIALLRQGASVEDLSKIHFLGKSRT